MPVKPMVTARSGAAIAVVGGRIYVIGGSRQRLHWSADLDFTGSSASMDYDCTEVYDPKTGHWTALGPMLDKRTRHRAAVVDGNIYVLGGTHWVGNSNVTLFSAEVLNPEQGHWVQVANMFTARCDFAVTVVGKKIYVAGGSQVWPREEQALDGAEIFDTQTGVWTPLPPMNRARCLCSSFLSVKQV